MAAAVDVPYLATHLGVSQDSLTTVATAPTADLVQAILEAVATKAHEYDTLYSEKLQVDIELENVVRSSEARCQTFKVTADNALKEVEEARRKLQAEETARQAIENELQTLKSSTTTSISEIDTLRARITSLETSNRETLAILDSKNAANAELSEELQKQHQKNLTLNQKLTSLQQEVQAAQSTANSAKFRESSLQQELEFAKRNADWLENELKTKSNDALKYRKEKGARIAELQRLNEEANSTIDSLTRSEQQLRSRLEDAQRKADEALSKVQQLQEAAARSEEGFRAEIESSRRLVELKEQQTETHRNRLREVELRLEQVKDEAAEEIRRIRQDLESVQTALAKSEEDVQQLQAEKDQLASRPPPDSAPQTPLRNGSQLRAASPFATPGSIVRGLGKSSITATQAMDELYRVKTELNTERRRTQQLSQELDEMMTALEAKGPEIDDLQQEAERLRNENIQMTRIADESYQERDIAKKAARKAEAANNTAQAEIKILRAQLRDLSTQIQLLVFNLQAQEKGFDQLTEDELRQFERLQKGQVAENSLDDMSDAQQFISEKFIAFKNVYELQQQNEELTKVVREMVSKMESEEELAKQQQAASDHEELEKLRETVVKLQEESQSVNLRLKSYMTERDMFRRLLQQKASAAEINSVLGNSIDGSHREVLASIEQTSNVDEGDLTIALRELQNNFDAYRQEQGVDRQTLREQADKLSAEKNSLHAEIARLNSQLQLATERFEMLHSNFTALQTENKELQKRNQQLSESAAKQDIRTQQVAEDLVEVRGQVESLRSENANLKAEKTLWKGIQERLNSDNEGLAQEKARLNQLLTDMQNIQNQRELDDAESRRRLQAQVDHLEAELNTTKRKLSEETEEAKKLQLRKEYETQQAQKRIDDLMASISQSKEELIATKTSRDHLQARVNELTIELRSAEERTQRLQPRPTPRAPVAQDTADDNDSEARIQELEEEVSELKRDLDIAKSRLEAADAQVESFKQLATAAEEDLNNLNESYASYQEEMDSSVSTRDAKIKELEQRVEAISTELTNTNKELSTVRDSQADVSRRYEDEKKILEAEIARLKDEEEKSKESAKWHQSDLREQADIAAKAQKAYEDELLKYAAVVTQLRELRDEYNSFRTEAATWKSEAESAKVMLAQGENSWEERRQQLEQEISELKTRREDANAQNKLLHQQLESVTAQIATLQQSRASLGDAGPGTPSAAADTATEGLRELNNYLRREKEILEVQYDLKTQEAKRLQQQLEYTKSQLDEASLKLEQERRQQADSSRASLTHQELMNKLNELNLIRESNVTLRNETQQAQAQLVQKTAKIEELESRIQPLDARISELENQKTFVEEELKQVQEDRDRWQKRTEGILSKYGQSDPAETEQLKSTIADLEAERDSLKQTEESLKQRIEELETNLGTERNGWKETRSKLVDQAKTKAREQNERIRELTAQKNELQEQLNSTTEKLTTTENDLETVRAEAGALQEQVNSQTRDSVATPPPEPVIQQAVNAADNAEWQQTVANLRGELETVSAQKAGMEVELENLRSQLATAIAERDQALRDAQAAAQSQQQSSSGPDTAMQNGTDVPQAAGATSGLSEEERKQLEEKIAAAEAKAAEFEEKAKQIEDKMETTLKERSNKMKDALNKRLKESKEQQTQELEETKTKLQEEYNLRLEQEKKIWAAENASAAVDQKPVPATPSKQADVPQTPVTGTPSAADLANLGDADTRDLLANNATIKSIVTSNIKKKVEIETKRIQGEVEQTLKSEYEGKLKEAREQGQLMAEKKSSLRINMAENKFKSANAKIEVVQTAAESTPQRPVGEVWAIAKVAKPAPATPAAAKQAPPSTGTAASSAAPTPTTGSNAGANKPQPTPTGLPQAPAPAPATNNPFTAQASNNQAPAGANPFTANQQPQPGTQQSQPQQQNQPGGGPARSNIPVPGGSGIPVPGGGRGAAGRGGPPRGGLYQAGPRGAAAAARGRGQNRNVSGGGPLNPNADNFAPGNKRPRNDSEAGAGSTKRPRGGGGPGAH